MLLTGEVMIPRVMSTDRPKVPGSIPWADSPAQSAPNRSAYREEFGRKFTFPYVKFFPKKIYYLLLVRKKLEVVLFPDIIGSQI